jgi:Cu2+-exporting ATPase
MHLHVGILSGDSSEAAQLVANNLAIEDAAGRLSPEAKRERIKIAQARGAVVAMVGDGVNDAPVLAQAQVSIAMGSGADLARTQADMVLMGDSLMPLADGVRIARRTLAIIRQNLAWAFAYNITAIPLAMAGWITPWMAGVGMSLSSLLVVLNALRLQRR